MASEQKQNALKCTKCGTVLTAPTKDREIIQCECSNGAWIQKRPDGQFWAYGSLDPMAHERIKLSNETIKAKKN